MKKILALLFPLFLTACSNTSQSSQIMISEQVKPIFGPKEEKSVEKTSIPDRIQISHTEWKELGNPLYDIDAYQDKFYKHKLKHFAITNDLINKADEYMYRLSKEDYVSIFQRHTTPETMNVIHHKIMQKEYLYTNEGPFCMEVAPDGTESSVDRPLDSGYQVDFTTLYSANPSENSYKINMIFHANKVYGKPEGLQQWAEIQYSKKGETMCCSTPSTLAAYQKNDTLEYNMSSELLRFPYFKRTEVSKHLKNNQVVKVDSTIMILKFGIHRVLSVGDQKKYVNGRMDSNFVNAELQLDLEY